MWSSVKKVANDSLPWAPVNHRRLPRRELGYWTSEERHHPYQGSFDLWEIQWIVVYLGSMRVPAEKTRPWYGYFTAVRWHTQDIPITAHFAEFRARVPPGKRPCVVRMAIIRKILTSAYYMLKRRQLFGWVDEKLYQRKLTDLNRLVRRFNRENESRQEEKREASWLILK